MRFILFALILCVVNSALGQQNDRLFAPNGKGTQSLMRAVEYFQDKTGSLNLEQVLNQHSDNFIPINTVNHSFGYTDDVIWLRFTLDLSEFHQERFFIIQEYEHLSKMELFYKSPSGKYITLLAGEDVKREQRQFDSRNMLFEIPSPSTNPTTYYLRLVPKKGIYTDVNLKWSDTQGLIPNLQMQNVLFGIFFGGLIVLWCYNFFLWIGTRDRLYFYYIYYLGSFIIVFFYLDGFANQATELTPGAIDFYRVAVYASMHGLVLFARQFLNLGSKIRWLDIWLQIEQWLIFVLGISYLFFVPTETAYYLSNVLILALSPPMLIAGYLRIFSGNTADRIYSLGWTFLVLSTVIYVLRVFGLIPANSVTQYCLQAGSVVEALLFSLALVSRFNAIEEAKRNVEREKIQIVENERSRLKKLVEESTESLQQELEIRKMMVANASHELRTPVNALKLHLDANVLSCNERRNSMSKVHTLVNHMSLVVEDLLLLDPKQRITEHEKDSVLSIKEEIYAAIKLVDPISQRVNANLTVDIKQCDKCFVIGKSLSFRRIIINLLSNALKHTPNGRVSLKARIRYTNVNNARILFCLIKIADTGKGIPSHMHQAIFEPFVTSAETYGNIGTGLGLPIARKLANDLGGNLKLLSSEENKGSVFQVLVGFQPNENQSLAIEKQETNNKGLPASPKRVLLAEDDACTAESMIAIIEHHKHKVHHVTTFAQLQTALSSNKFDVAFVDNQLPGGLGIDAIQQYRLCNHERTTQIILLTADAIPELLSVAKKICDEIIVKPTSAQKIRIILNGHDNATAIDAPSKHANSIVDHQLFSSLRESGIGNKEIRHIVEIFFINAENVLKEIEFLISDHSHGNNTELEKVVHRFKSSCLTVGAVALSKLLQELSYYILRNEATQWFGETYRTFELTKLHLEELLNNEH